MDENRKCPKCQAIMVQGFIPIQLISSWVKGHPQKSFFTRLKKVPVAERIPIAAFRCNGCGYLEFYADVISAAQ
jgi:predicted nucleic-acid-binding Zn-ribbon protein